MAQISAKTDAFVMPLNRLETVVDLVVKRAWAVVVDRYAYIVFSDKLVETFERVGRWVCRDIFNACNLCKLKGYCCVLPRRLI